MNIEAQLKAPVETQDVGIGDLFRTAMLNAFISDASRILPNEAHEKLLEAGLDNESIARACGMGAGSVTAVLAAIPVLNAMAIEYAALEPDERKVFALEVHAAQQGYIHQIDFSLSLS